MPLVAPLKSCSGPTMALPSPPPSQQQPSPSPLVHCSHTLPPASPATLLPRVCPSLFRLQGREYQCYVAFPFLLLLDQQHLLPHLQVRSLRLLAHFLYHRRLQQAWVALVEAWRV